jgi:uncharacterized membrane protein HdeD (DUF308 family)
MLLNPMVKDDAGWNHVLERASKRWCSVLFSGALSSGLLGVAAGIVVVAWPGPTLLITAIFIGVAIVAWGTMNVAGAISNRRWASYWWVVLVLGILELLLGLWLLRRPGLTLAVAITATAFWALFIGVTQTIVAFEIRHLPERLSR